MTCPDCKTGILSRNKKPDALGRVIERCDTCQYRRVVDAPDSVPALSGILARTHAAHTTLAPVVHAAPVAVVGQPCPCCHRKVAKLPICAKCKKNRRVLGKVLCEECGRPASLRPRYCVKCGERFIPQRGEKLTGTAAYHCPAHRSKKSTLSSHATVGTA
jgi:hypothetical protein